VRHAVGSARAAGASSSPSSRAGDADARAHDYSHERHVQWHTDSWRRVVLPDEWEHPHADEHVIDGAHGGDWSVGGPHFQALEN